MRNELKYSRALEQTGLSREQAEVHLSVIEEAMKDNVATKEDTKNLELLTEKMINESSTRIEIKIADNEAKIMTTSTRLEAKIDELDARLGARIDELDARLGAKIAANSVKIDEVETRLGLRIDALEDRIQIIVTRGIVATVGALGGIMTIFEFLI